MTVANPVLLEVHRGPGIESVHRGILHLVGQDRDLVSLGDPDQVCYPRSGLKPLQALPVLEEGLEEKWGLSDAEITLITASHGGEARHAEAVDQLLQRAGIPIEALDCGVHVPFDRNSRADLIRDGREPSVLHNNCSGKHTGMLLLAQALGHPLEGYTNPDHPVQQRIRRTIAEMSGLEASDLSVSIDGCNAPAFGLSVRAMARALQRFAAPDGLPPERRSACQRVFDAVQSAPDYLSTAKHIDQALVKTTRGRGFVKRGAEGVLGFAIRGEAGGLGGVLKVEDGSTRGYGYSSILLFRAMGFPLEGIEALVSRQTAGVVKNHQGREVGSLQPGAELQATLESLSGQCFPKANDARTG